jgi:uncharacterized protein (DUF302 family)
MMTQENEPGNKGGKRTGRSWILVAGGGLGAGLLLALAAVLVVMPKMMIVTHESPLGFDETVAAIENGISENGWTSPGTEDMNRKLATQGVDFKPRVKIIRMCRADYAESVLTTDRYLSCLMPCSVSVWEGDNGKVYVSKMNTGLMGKMFGGNVAAVMGGNVARDEERILRGVREG